MARTPTYGLVRPGRCCTESLRRLSRWVRGPAQAMLPRVVVEAIALSVTAGRMRPLCGVVADVAVRRQHRDIASIVHVTDDVPISIQSLHTLASMQVQRARTIGPILHTIRWAPRPHEFLLCLADIGEQSEYASLRSGLCRPARSPIGHVADGRGHKREFAHRLIRKDGSNDCRKLSWQAKHESR